MDLKNAETMDFNLALDYMKKEYAKSYGETKFYLHDAIVFMLRYKKLIEEQPQIVRCKDCMYGEQLFPDYISCQISDENESGCHASHKPEWFCADGVRKET